tara:strand:+ start:239 stop:436 length:198 start_codon:yes stop_codon:yes gene_type:complete
MQSRNKSIKEKSAIINQYYKNTYRKNPEIETTLKLHSSLKKKKLTKLKRRVQYRKYSLKREKNKK